MTCINFSGLQNESCKANHRYLDVAIPLTQSQIDWHNENYPELDMAGTAIGKRVPCFAKNGISTCSDFREPTQTELDQQEIEIKNIIERTMKARIAIVEYLKSKNLLRSNTSGKISCPICETGTLHFSIAGAYNGHIHAKCTTDKCVEWME